MNMTFINTMIVELGMLTPVVVAIVLIIKGFKCLLRSEMVRIYYKCKDSQTIRQYEYENFEHLHKAYKALKGNSFIDKIWKEVQDWDVVS